MAKTDGKNYSLGKGGKIALFVGMAVIIILLVIVIILLISRNNVVADNVGEKETKRNVVVTKENAEEAVTEMVMDEYIEPGYYSCSMTNVWHFATGDAISEDAFVENKEENTNDIYFDVFLSDNEDEPILQSPIIPRGAQLDNITLDKHLEAGTYGCVVVYHLVDEDQTTLSTLRVGITVIIED